MATRTRAQLDAQKRNFTIMRLRGAYHLMLEVDRDFTNLGGYPEAVRIAIDKTLAMLYAESESARIEKWQRK